MKQKNVIVEEFELATISQSIINYVDLLKESIESYNDILNMVENDGFTDIKLTNNLTKLANEANNEVSKIAEIGPDIHKHLNDYMEIIEDIDQFTFPSELEGILCKALNL